MDPRVRTLLSWQLRFQARRTSTWGFGAAYLVMALKAILLSPDLPTVAPGQLPFRFLQTVHALTAVVAAIYLAGQSMDDKPSGTLGFLKVSNLEPRSWVAFRFTALVLAYVPVWLLRIPVYVLVLSLGGVMLSEVLWLEAAQWVAFLCLGSLALLVARYSTTGSALAVSTLIVVVLWHAILHFPLIVLGLLSIVQDQPFSVANHPVILALSHLALPKYFWTFPATSLEWSMALAGFALHIGLALALLRMFARVVYFNAGTELTTEEPALTRAERRSTTRPSRRVSDDPLAWQACYIHSGTGTRARIGAVVVTSIFVLILVFGIIDETVPRSVILGVACGLPLVILAFKPSDCLSRELKAKTLSTLALLPLDGRELYAGWLRGMRRLARSTYVAVAGGGLLLAIIAPEAAPYAWMVLAFAALLLPEVAFLSNVTARKVSFLEFNLIQMFMNLWVVFLIAVLLAISLPIAIGIDAWAGLAVFVGLLLIARQLLLADFPGYVADRMEQEQ